MLFIILAGLGVGGAGLHARLTTNRLSERLDVGCFDVDDCRALVHAAESARETCWLGCSRLGELTSQARSKFRSALEQAALQERQREDDDYQRAAAQRREAENAQSELMHAQRLEALDRQHRHELAMVEAETARLREEKVRLAASRVAYLRQLSKEQRLRRLITCHAQGAGCDDLALLLSEAATSETERFKLIDVHERHVTATPARAASGTPPAAGKSGSEALNSEAPAAKPL